MSTLKTIIHRLLSSQDLRLYREPVNERRTLQFLVQRRLHHFNATRVVGISLDLTSCSNRPSAKKLKHIVLILRGLALSGYE